jgi:3-methyl-2-oxobutanoate hydroxymethyltransferase
MSVQLPRPSAVQPVTTHTLHKFKREGRPIVALTAYDYALAKLVDQAGVDLILVGDSLGNVVQGHDSTLPVTVDDIIYHCRAVRRAIKRAHLVGDMPFMSYHVSPEQALQNAGRLMQEGACHSVKLEGGQEVAATVRRITAAGIPVMGHIGLTPQSVHQLGGHKVQGRSDEARAKLLLDAQALQDAGAYAVVLECVPEALSDELTKTLAIPTIGIGAGKRCDGQILVLHDMLGLLPEFTPRFVRRFSNLGELLLQAVERYGEAVRDHSFPARAETFDPLPEETLVAAP